MAVNIEVKLNKIDSTDIAKVKSQLRELGDDIDLDLDVDEIISGDLDEIKVRIDEEHIQDQLQRALGDISGDMDGEFGSFGDGNGSGPPSAMARTQLNHIITELEKIRRAIVSGDMIESDPNEHTGPFSLDVGEFSRSSSSLGNHGFNLSESEFFNELIPEGQREFIKRSTGIRDVKGGADDLGQSLWENRLDDLMERDGGRLETYTRQSLTGISRDSDGNVSFGGIDRDKRRLQKMSNMLNSVGTSAEFASKILRKLRPTFKGIRAAMITLLPALVAVGAQAAAVAGSFVALGAAAGAIGLLGMLGGEAKTLEGSLASAEERMKEFKQGLFEAVEPVADAFAPIVDRFLDAIIQNVAALRGELMGLGSFSGILMAGLNATFDLIGRILGVINELQPEIEAVAGFWGSIITSGVAEFFKDVIQEGLKTSDTLYDIAVLAWQLGRALYNVIKIISNFVGVLAGFSGIISFIADVLGNKWVQALLTSALTLVTFIGLISFVTTLVGGLTSALAANAGMWAILKASMIGSWIQSAIYGIGTLIGYVAALNSTLAQTVALVGLATGGIAIAAGGAALAGGLANQIGNIFSPDVPGGAGGGQPSSGNFAGGNKVEMNIYGEMDNQNRQAMWDVANSFDKEQGLQNGQF